MIFKWSFLAYIFDVKIANSNHLEEITMLNNRSEL